MYLLSKGFQPTRAHASSDLFCMQQIEDYFTILAAGAECHVLGSTHLPTLEQDRSTPSVDLAGLLTGALLEHCFQQENLALAGLQSLLMMRQDA